MPGQFKNTGTTPGGNLKLVNNSNSGNFALSTATGFTVYSSDFNTVNTGYGCEGDNTGFSIGGPYKSGQAFYQANFDINTGGNIAKADQIAAYFAANGLTINNNSYLFNISYGPGSTVSSGIAVVSFYYYSNAAVWLNIGTVDTSIPGWDTPGTDPFNSLTALNGTFYLPFTFSVYNPITQDPSDWC